MPLDRLSQITEVGIKSGITLRNINVEGAYVSGVITATTLNADNYIGNATGRINPTTLNVTGVATFNSNVFHGDGDIAYFGDGNDLLIFHNSTDSIIRDNGTGDLFIEGGNRIRLTNPTGIETYAVFNQDGASELYFDNVKRFETTNAGVTISGSIGVGTALLVNGNARITGILTIGTSSITLDGSNNQVNVGTGVTLHHSNGVQVGGNNLHSTGLFLNTLNVGAGGTIITSTSGGNIGIGTNVPRAKLDIGGGSVYNAGTYQSPLVSVSGGYLSIKSQNADGVSRLTLIGDSATGDGTIDWGGNGNFNLKFTNNGSERARIDSSGRFGIGTNNPQYPLDVNGNIRSTNQIYSTVAQGTAPFVVSSTTRVDNLNANFLGGYAGDQYFGFNYTTVNVGGNANTWYPVLFRRHAFPTTYYVRKYIHDYQMWDGVLSFVYMCHTGSWGGDASWDKIIYHAYSTRQFIGAIGSTSQSNSYTILWLLGGGRNYQCSTQPFVGEYPTVYLNGGTVEGTTLNSISTAQSVATGWEP